MAILGCDVGLDGACAFMDAGKIIAAWSIPTLELKRGGKTKREIDSAVLADWIESQTVDQAFVEQVGAVPAHGKDGARRFAQGASSAFAFGKCYGIVLGVLGALDIPVTLVSSVKWKRDLRVPAAKDGSRARASELMPAYAHLWTPRRGERHAAQCGGIAESALIAEWGRRSLERVAA